MPLTSNERLLIEHGYRAGLLHEDIAPLVGLSRRECSELLESLTETGYLGNAPLFADKLYYFFERRAAQCGVPEAELGPITREREKMLRWVMFRFSVMRPAWPLTETDCTEHFSELFPASEPNPRFRDHYLAEVVPAAGGRAVWSGLGRARFCVYFALKNCLIGVLLCLLLVPGR